MSNLQRLATWCAQQPDAQWESENGVRIERIDDPGWRVRIDLRGTVAVGRHHLEIRRLCPGEQWLHCRVKGNCFEGCGGPFMLDVILEHFLQWAGAGGGGGGGGGAGTEDATEAAACGMS